MTFNDIIINLNNGKNIFDIPFKVAYYARVSTDSNEQLNSLENQMNYYEDYIKKVSNWTFVEGYIDEGITGVSVKKRTSFKKMISDALSGKFNLIITKEVSRFARDLEDSIHYIRKLKAADVGVFFENQNLNTFDPNSELILNIMFNLAQEESRKLSSRIKFGHREAIKKGHVLGSSNIIGYKKENCKLVIIPNEANFIKNVYSLYATGEYGFCKLAKKLSSMGYLNKNGNLYDKDTLKRIIKNPKYKGYYRACEYEVIDYRTKKRKKNLIENQVLYKTDNDIIPAIVSCELWDKANDILDKRTKEYTSSYYTGSLKYPFSSKLICKEHNTNFQRSHGSKTKNRPVWACGRYLQYRLEACQSPIILEEDLYAIVNIIKDLFIIDKNKIKNNIFNLYKSIDYDEFGNVKDIEKKINNLEEKKSFALELAFNKELDKSLLKKQFNLYENEIQKLIKQKFEIEKQKKELNDFDKSKDLLKKIENELENNIINDFIRLFIHKIIVSKIKNNRHNIKLEFFLKISDEETFNNWTLIVKDEVIKSVEKNKKEDLINNYTFDVYLNRYQ